MNTYDILMSPMKIIQVCFNMGDAPLCGNLNRKIMTLTVGFGIVSLHTIYLKTYPLVN